MSSLKTDRIQGIIFNEPKTENTLGSTLTMHIRQFADRVHYPERKQAIMSRLPKGKQKKSSRQTSDLLADDLARRLGL